MPEKILPHQNPNTPTNLDARWQRIQTTQLNDGWVTQRLEKVATLIPPHVHVIDLASGPGLIQRYLPIGVSYTPVDFSPEALKLAGGSGILAHCTSVPLPPKEFHTVLAMEILEHLDQDTDLIHQAMALATVQCIFTVPNHRLSPKELPYHRRTYTQQSLLQLLHPFTLSQCAQLSPYGPFTSVTILHTPGNLIAQCTIL